MIGDIRKKLEKFKEKHLQEESKNPAQVKDRILKNSVHFIESPQDGAVSQYFEREQDAELFYKVVEQCCAKILKFGNRIVQSYAIDDGAMMKSLIKQFDCQQIDSQVVVEAPNPVPVKTP